MHEMKYHVEVKPLPHFPEHHGEHVRRDVPMIGIAQPSAVRFSTVYSFEGELSAADTRRIAEELLIDPVTETCVIEQSGASHSAKIAAKTYHIEVWLKNGVTDTVADSVVKAVRDLGIAVPLKVKTGQRYVFSGAASAADVRHIAERLLVNPMIQEYTLS